MELQHQDLQENRKRNLVKNPTAREATFVFIAWLVGVTLLVLGVTDVFRESFFVYKNSVAGFLVLISIFMMLKFLFSFFKTKEGI